MDACKHPFMLQLVEAGGRLVPGKIRDSNRPTLMALFREHSVDYTDLGIAEDTYVDLTDHCFISRFCYKLPTGLRVAPFSTYFKYIK